MANTREAFEEGITDVAWYRKDQLKNEIVYPPVLLRYDWNLFSHDNLESKFLELREAYF